MEKKMFEPSYLKIFSENIFHKRIESAKKLMNPCTLCPRECKTNRFEKFNGFCQSGYLPIVSSFTSHFGEEPIISGVSGAGNIFFGNCNLACVFCQNYEISQNWKYEKLNEVTFERLSDIMIELQSKGCHNIGLVSPTHFTYQFLEALNLAITKGLKIPIVYNSNGYDSVEILKLLDGIVDIYLPDFKYGINQDAKEFSLVDNYFGIAKDSISEMYRQVGAKLVLDNGILQRGLVIRHLVLPNNLSETENIFKFLSMELDSEITVSLMSQYFPSNKAGNYILLNRKLRFSEYQKAMNLLDKYGLKNGWIQELESYDFYKPNFNLDRENPFSF